MTTRGERLWLSEALWPAVLAGALYGPAVHGIDVLADGEAWSWSAAAVRSVLFGVCMALGLLVRLRFPARARERAAVERVVSAGVLPEGAGSEWVGRLVAEGRRLRVERVVLPLIPVGVAALVAVGALGARGPAVAVWLYVAGLVAVGVVVGLWRHRRMRTAERLRAELEQRLAHA